MRVTDKMQTALDQYRETGSLDGVHHHTRAALERHGLLEMQQPLAEIIGDERTYSYRWYDAGEHRWSPTLDARRGDYGFWDRARKGKVAGLELAGAFLKPLENKIATWVLGATPKFASDNDDLPGLVAEWWNDHQGEILQGMRESVGLGDCYLVFNGDGSLTVVPPHIVDPIVADDDYSDVVGYRIVQRYEHPLETGRSQQILNYYYADRREEVMRYGGTLGERRRQYPNPLGIIPVVKIPNDATSGEMNGRPAGESIVRILEAYNDVLKAAIEGNVRQGRPTPTLENIDPKSIASLIDKMGVDVEYLDKNGKKQTRKELRFTSDNLMMTPGTFKYAQPGAFVGETEKLLGLLFYLILQHTEIPEFVWGNAIASSKASAESQMPAFSKFVEGKQTSIAHWLNHLMQLVVAWYATFERGVSEDDVVKVVHAPLTDADGRLTLDAIKLGREQMLLDRDTALRLMPLDVDDPQAVLAAVDAEIEAERDELEAMRTRQAERDAGFEDPDTDDEDSESDDEEANAAETLRVMEAEQKHTGAMAAFYLPEDQARQLYGVAAMELEANADVLMPQELHLTLAYMGEADELPQGRLRRVVREFAQVTPPISGEVSGMGRFSNTHIEGMDAIYASFDAPDLAVFRQNLVRALMEAGVEPNRAHGFTPHITLAYIPDEEPTPNLRIPVIPVQFDSICLALGEEKVVYPLMQVEQGEEPVPSEADTDEIAELALV